MLQRRRRPDSGWVWSMSARVQPRPTPAKSHSQTLGLRNFRAKGRPTLAKCGQSPSSTKLSRILAKLRKVQPQVDQDVSTSSQLWPNSGNGAENWLERCLPKESRQIPPTWSTRVVVRTSLLSPTRDQTTLSRHFVDASQSFSTSPAPPSKGIGLNVRSQGSRHFIDPQSTLTRDLVDIDSIFRRH